MKRISPTLVMNDETGGQICCGACGHVLASGKHEHWKDRAALVAQPAAAISGWPSSVHQDLVLRQFTCPGCGHLLDSETALPEDPFLYDVLD